MAGTWVVCGGGGVWGVAWLTGLVAGLMDEGVDLRTADAFVGTSAGSVVSAQIAAGADLEALFAAQAEPARQSQELSPDTANMGALMALMQRPWPDPQARVAAVAELAVNARTAPYVERREAIAGRMKLAGEAWPDKRLLITAVDVETCALKAFEASDGADLIDAIAASCAVPGVWPPAPIGGRTYMDGGLWRTAENAQLAAGADVAVILSPMGAMVRLMASGAATPFDKDVEALRAGGTRVVVVEADQTSIASMNGAPLDPATRAPGAKAGRAQGLKEAARLKAFLA